MPYRAFLHRPEEIEALLRGAGFHARAVRKTLVWHVIVYARARIPAASCRTRTARPRLEKREHLPEEPLRRRGHNGVSLGRKNHNLRIRQRRGHLCGSMYEHQRWSAPGMLRGDLSPVGRSHVLQSRRLLMRM